MNGDRRPTVTILNADGVYVGTITALLLSLKLLNRGYYQTKDKTVIPHTEVSELVI